MNGKLIVCFTVAFVAQIFGAPLDMDQPNLGDCPDGSPNGAQLERGRFFYECRNGNFVPKGCMTEDLKKITVGQTADKRHYRVECKLGSGDLLSLEAIACLHQGRDHKIDEQWEDGANYYTCKKDGADLRTVNLGCLDQGKRVPLKEKVVNGEFVTVCNETVNNGARMMQVGCVKEGRQYNTGESFEFAKFWYNCTRTGTEKVSTKMSGCVANGKRLNDGDRFFDNDVIYECRIDSSTKGELVTAGCVQRDERGEVVERRLGCTWVEGQAPFQYELACQQDPATNSAKKVPVRCNYKVGGGVYNIDPGCYRLVEKAAFGCQKESTGSLKLQSFQGQDAERAATSAGLRLC
jgi:hypothetical protein